MEKLEAVFIASSLDDICVDYCLWDGDMDLLICYTPLHVIISEALIKKGEIRSYVLVYICFGRNEKHEYYYSRLSKLAEHSVFVEMKHAPFYDALKVLKLRFGVLAGFKFNRMFTGNVKHIYSRLLALLCGGPAISTYDDGSGNISGGGYFYDMNESRLSTWLFALIAPSYHYKNVVRRIDKHYTIYSFDNVYSSFATKLVQVSLFSAADAHVLGEAKSIVVYLGNAFAKDGLCSMEYEDALDKYAAEKFSAECVIPHPRNVKSELYKELGLHVVGGGMIAEDVILEQLMKGVRVRVVGVYSSVLFNIAGLNGVDVVNVRAKIAKPVEHLEKLLVALGVSIDNGFVVGKIHGVRE